MAGKAGSRGAKDGHKHCRIPVAPFKPEQPAKKIPAKMTGTFPL
jgi:hypothetical protein